MKTVGNKVPWYKQTCSLEQFCRHSPSMIAVLLVGCGYSLFRALSPHHPGDYNGAHNWFLVSLGTIALFFWLVMPFVMRWMVERAKRSKP